MQGLPSILSLFRKEFNTFNNTRMSVRLYISYDIKINSYLIFWHENVKNLSLYAQ